MRTNRFSNRKQPSVFRPSSRGSSRRLPSRASDAEEEREDADLAVARNGARSSAPSHSPPPTPPSAATTTTPPLPQPPLTPPPPPTTPHPTDIAWVMRVKYPVAANWRSPHSKNLC